MDSSFVITPTQLRQTNIVFAEHQKLLEEKDEYLKQINYLDAINQNYYKIDSLRNQQLNVCKDLVNAKQDTINSLNESWNKSKKHNRIKNCIIGGLSAIVIAAVFLIIFK